MKKSWFAWWHTQCQYCKKARMLIFWLLLMLLADAMWFNLLIK